MSRFIILLLSLLCLTLLFLHLKQRKSLYELHAVLQAVKNNEKKKAFIYGKGITSQIGFEINEFVSFHNEEMAQQRKMEQANKELLTSLSHDVRTPLTSLLGYLDALDSDMVFGAEKEEYIKIARKKAYDLKDFVDTLFNWFKIDSGEMKLSVKPTDVCELTKEIVIDWLPILEQKTIIPDIVIPDDVYIVSIDSAAYRRMVSNLIQNALEHSGCSYLKVMVKQVDSTIAITIKDDGSGISEDKLPHVFERMYKADHARSRNSSGLGLCIVKELCEMQGGKIEVQSKINQYTKFMITLPYFKR